jgi:hypothetical protein
LGDNFLRERKVRFNLKESTISIMNNQPCKYEPYAAEIKAGSELI